MKVLIVTGSPLERVGTELYAYDTWLKLVRNLQGELGTVTIWSPVHERTGAPPSDAWHFEPSGIRVETHEYFNSFITYYRGWPLLQQRLRRQAAALIREHDVVVLRTPTPMIGLVMREAVRQRKPVLMMVLGNLATQAAGLTTFRGVKRRVFSWLVDLAVRQEVRHGRRAALLAVYSREIAVRHERAGSRPIVMQDPILHLDDLIARDDTCTGERIRIVRVSWLVSSKGLEFLIEAVALLRDQGIAVQLELIGHERVAGYERSLRDLAEARGVAAQVRFRGWVAADHLAAEYLAGDIQVISSLSEGTPRCIAEGSARGLPLVCTAVGGCVDILRHEDNALLVPPADAAAIAAAVRRLIEDGELRRGLIRRGYSTAREATFETLGAQFVGAIRALARDDQAAPVRPAVSRA